MASSDLFYSTKFTFCYKTSVIETRYQLQREKHIQNTEKGNCPLSHLLCDFRTRWNFYRWVFKLIYMLTEINHSTPKEEGGLDFFLKKYFLYCLFLKHLDSQSLEHSGFFLKEKAILVILGSIWIVLFLVFLENNANF